MAARNPKAQKFILLMIIYILSTIGIFIFFILQILGFVQFAELDDIILSHTYPQVKSYHSVEALANLMIKSTLPVVKFEDLILTSKINSRDQDCCAICLSEYEGQDEINFLPNCCHIFHGSCLDRWMINNHTTCPLCRTSSIPIQMNSGASKRE
ncbi:hypothetical protein MKW98_021155 [Papaver atlanticum]|uniref:RING-type domain-containing protein n=1 Tax=Papaver atlanticum TaxID=357466 RepID=A0AAD4XSU9_9MAGN|nr:hypothetical protein MKW98_021155 [Papaver atlanticum]